MSDLASPENKWTFFSSVIRSSPDLLLSHTSISCSVCVEGESLSSVTSWALFSVLAFGFSYLQSHLVYVAITAMTYSVENMLGKCVISDTINTGRTITRWWSAPRGLWATAEFNNFGSMVLWNAFAWSLFSSLKIFHFEVICIKMVNVKSCAWLHLFPSFFLRGVVSFPLQNRGDSTQGRTQGEMHSQNNCNEYQY